MGVATVEHMSLSAAAASGCIEAASGVLLPSLAFHPCATKRRLRPWQLLPCLGSTNRVVTADLGFCLVYFNANYTEEVAETVMALILSTCSRAMPRWPRPPPLQLAGSAPSNPCVTGVVCVAALRSASLVDLRPPSASRLPRLVSRDRAKSPRKREKFLATKDN